MSVVTTFTAGTFAFPGYCSLDERATREFYCGLLGWDAVDQKMGENTYTSFKVNGSTVAGMYELPEDRKQAGVKPHWNSYIAVDSVKDTVNKVLEMGGKRLGGPSDASEDEMANLEDPTGVRFSVLPVVMGNDPSQAIRKDEVGALCWNELCTKDAATASRFYTEVLGWSAAPFEGGEMPYTIFLMPGHEKGVAGMLEITPEMEASMTAQWLPYFQVEDADAAASKAKELGGEAHGPIDIPNVGRIVYVTDNQRAGFAVIEVAMPPLA